MSPVGETAEWSISQVAARTGVPIATIKFYIREGLLPRPRTSGRTVGRYDQPFINRLLVIRDLRHRHRLTLREIGRLLEEIGPDASLTDVELRVQARRRLDTAIDPAYSLPPVTAGALRTRCGLAADDIEGLGRYGLLTPISDGDEVFYSEGDARIAEVVGALRRSGYHEQLGFTIADLAKYVEALRQLVVKEVAPFDKPALRALPPGDALRLIEQGVANVDVLLGLLHKKLLVQQVHEQLASRGRPAADDMGRRRRG